MKPKVLFVDDEQRVLTAMQRLFQRDCEITVTNSGYTALELLRDNDIDVIVCDQLMPEITGVEVLRACREVSPRTIRILLTGHADLDAAIQSVNEGEIFRYINKPWNNQDLITTVLEAARKSQEPRPPEPITPPPASEKPAVTTGLLLVDQDAELAEMVASVIHEDIELFPAESPGQALTLVAENDIGVAIVDTALGGEKATELVFQLHEKYPDIVIIIITYRADITHLVELINSGRIYRFLPKPVRVSILQPNIASAMAKYARNLKAHEARTKRAEATQSPATAKQQEHEEQPDSRSWINKLVGWVQQRLGRGKN